MTKQNAHFRGAYLGRFDAEFHDLFRRSPSWGEIPALDTVSEPRIREHLLDVLLLGRGLAVDQVLKLLPSLRVSDPTLVIATLDGPDGEVLRPWVDHVIDSRLEAAQALALFAAPERRSLWEKVGRSGLALLSQLAPLAASIALWSVAVAFFRPPPYLLPAPRDVLHAFLEHPSRYLLHLATTANEALLGFLIGNSLAFAIAVLLHRYQRVRTLTMPVLIGFQTIPIVAFAPLLGVWLGAGLSSKTAMAVIICFFPMVVNTLQAFASVDRAYIELFALYRANYWATLGRLLIPASMHSLIAALKISAGLAVVGAIVAEMTGADRGLGYLILNGAYRLETDILFVAMSLSGILGMGFFRLPDTLRFLLPRAWTRTVT